MKFDEINWNETEFDGMICWNAAIRKGTNEIKPECRMKAELKLAGKPRKDKRILNWRQFNEWAIDWRLNEWTATNKLLFD